ncbi:MAG TPA: hypothetical protein VNI84_10595 [Pyrinomonadaceae bacterium]|nr:hypothetical protein [Pyrinomonadaceae bacterium]
MNIENDFAKLRELLESRREWLLVDSSGKSFALGTGEIELELKTAKILVGFLDDKGFQTWRIVSFERKGDEIRLALARNFERERRKIRLVPRVSANDLSALIEAARLEKANEITRFIIAETPGAKLVRVALNIENGRLAQIMFEKPNGKQIAALSDVSGAATHENLLAFAILWLAKLQRRKKKPVETIWISADEKRSKNLQKLLALLRENWRDKIEIFEISRKGAKARSGAENALNQSLKKVESIALESLWREKPKKIKASENAQISCAAQEIVKLAPENIDVVLTKQGETVRFLGLPFARVRRISGEEKVWFGVENKRQILIENNFGEFAGLIEELKIYRRFDAENKRHAFFRLALEAWLEAMLRRDIKLLDANLILSPIHNQFRADRDKIDLLALRRDNRLVVVELKVSPDREMIFQTIDYWRKIELQRRKGNLQAAKIFGDLKIAPAPALCYLVAPLLSFHRDFDFLAQTVSKEIEIYHFDLNENWRENLKVMRRNRC